MKNSVLSFQPVVTIGQVWNSTGSLFAVRQHWHRPGGNGCHDAGDVDYHNGRHDAEGFRCYDGGHDGGSDGCRDDGGEVVEDDKDVDIL